MSILKSLLFKIIKSIYPLLVFGCVLWSISTSAQKNPLRTDANAFSKYFEELEFKVDTLTFLYSKQKIKFRDVEHLAFRYTKEESVAEIYLQVKAGLSFKQLSLLPSGDFQIVDSLMHLGGDSYRAKIRFKQITKSDFLGLKFRFKESNIEEFKLTELKLFPYTPTLLEFYPNSDELFIGEEKVFELTCSNP